MASNNAADNRVVSGDQIITSGNLTLPTTTATVGQITINATRWAHAFGTSNTFVGSASGNLTSAIDAENNTGVGINALQLISVGSGNVAVGGNALSATENGANNVAIGFRAAAVAGPLSFCTAVGASAGLGLSSDERCTAIGSSTLATASLNRSDNTAVGSNALTLNSAGGFLTAIGSGSLSSFTGGLGSAGTNTAVGYRSAYLLVEGSNNVFLGNSVGSAYTGAESSNILIGNAGVLGESNVMRLGDNGVGAGQVSTTYIAGAITGASSITATTGLAGATLFITPTEVTAASVALAVNSTYIMNRGTLITATLPAAAVLGSTFRIVGKGAGGWLIAQNAGQTIHILGSNTTTGVGGSLASTTQYDCLELMCTTANTNFVVYSSMGNLTVV
jgi:hypothetical protein